MSHWNELITKGLAQENRARLHAVLRRRESHNFTIKSILEDLEGSHFQTLFELFKINNVPISECSSDILDKKLSDVIFNMRDDLGGIILHSDDLKEQEKSERKFQENKILAQKERKELCFWHYNDLSEGCAHHYLYDGPYLKLKTASKDIQDFVNDIKATSESERFIKLCEAAAFLKELLNQ